jgi:hypothetical protein
MQLHVLTIATVPLPSLLVNSGGVVVLGTSAGISMSGRIDTVVSCEGIKEDLRVWKPWIVWRNL